MNIQKSVSLLGMITKRSEKTANKAKEEDSMFFLSNTWDAALICIRLAALTLYIYTKKNRIQKMIMGDLKL